MASIQFISISSSGVSGFEIPIGSDGLKIKQHHYETLQNAIDKVLAKYPTVMDEYREQRLSQTTVCQKLLYGAGIEKWITETLNYLSAEDLMKALTRICPSVEE